MCKQTIDAGWNIWRNVRPNGWDCPTNGDEFIVASKNCAISRPPKRVVFGYSHWAKIAQQLLNHFVFDCSKKWFKIGCAIFAQCEYPNTTRLGGREIAQFFARCTGWVAPASETHPVFDKPAFSRFSQIFQPLLVVHSFMKIVKRQVCQIGGWVADGWVAHDCPKRRFWKTEQRFWRVFSRGLCEGLWEGLCEGLCEGVSNRFGRRTLAKSLENAHARHTVPFMHPKRRYSKTLQTVWRVVSNDFARVWVLDFGYEPSQSPSKRHTPELLFRFTKSAFGGIK